MNVLTMLRLLLSGMGMTALIFFVTLILSLPLGMGISFCRMSKNPVLRGITKVYISIMRGTPLMLQLLVVRYGPYFIFDSYDLYAVLIAFVINYAAYFAEIYRSGIESIPQGQYEAARLLGFGKGRTFTMIILPQVIKRVLPSITNETITLVKDTSLAFTIGVIEMFTRAKQIAKRQCCLMFLREYYIIFSITRLLSAWKKPKRLSDIMR